MKATADGFGMSNIVLIHRLVIDAKTGEPAERSHEEQCHVERKAPIQPVFSMAQDYMVISSYWLVFST